MSKDNLKIEIITTSGHLSALQDTLRELNKEMQETKNTSNPSLISIKDLIQKRMSKSENVLINYIQKLSDPGYTASTEIEAPDSKNNKKNSIIENAIIEIVYCVGAFKSLKIATDTIRKAIQATKYDIHKSLIVDIVDIEGIEKIVQILFNIENNKSSDGATLVSEISRKMAQISEKIASILTHIIFNKHSECDYTTTYRFQWFALLLQQAYIIAADAPNEKFLQFIAETLPKDKIIVDIQPEFAVSLTDTQFFTVDTGRPIEPRASTAHVQYDTPFPRMRSQSVTSSSSRMHSSITSTATSTFQGPKPPSTLKPAVTTPSPSPRSFLPHPPSTPWTPVTSGSSSISINSSSSASSIQGISHAQTLTTASSVSTSSSIPKPSGSSSSITLASPAPSSLSISPNSSMHKSQSFGVGLQWQKAIACAADIKTYNPQHLLPSPNTGVVSQRRETLSSLPMPSPRSLSQTRIATDIKEKEKTARITPSQSEQQETLKNLQEVILSWAPTGTLSKPSSKSTSDLESNKKQVIESSEEKAGSFTNPTLTRVGPKNRRKPTKSLAGFQFNPPSSTSIQPETPSKSSLSSQH